MNFQGGINGLGGATAPGMQNAAMLNNSYQFAGVAQGQALVTGVNMSSFGQANAGGAALQQAPHFLV